jgi:hypothetical protein
MYFSKGIFLIALAGFAEVAYSRGHGAGKKKASTKRNFIMVVPYVSLRPLAMATTLPLIDSRELT